VTPSRPRLPPATITVAGGSPVRLRTRMLHCLYIVTGWQEGETYMVEHRTLFTHTTATPEVSSWASLSKETNEAGYRTLRIGAGLGRSITTTHDWSTEEDRAEWTHPHTTGVFVGGNLEMPIAPGMTLGELSHTGRIGWAHQGIPWGQPNPNEYFSGNHIHSPEDREYFISAPDLWNYLIERFDYYGLPSDSLLAAYYRFNLDQGLQLPESAQHEIGMLAGDFTLPVNLGIRAITQRELSLVLQEITQLDETANYVDKTKRLAERRSQVDRVKRAAPVMIEEAIELANEDTPPGSVVLDTAPFSPLDGFVHNSKAINRRIDHLAIYANKLRELAAAEKATHLNGVA